MDAVGGAFARWNSRRAAALALVMAVLVMAVAWPLGAAAQVTPDAGTAPPSADAGAPTPTAGDPDAGTAPRAPEEPASEPTDGGAAAGGTTPPPTTGATTSGTGTTGTTTTTGTATTTGTPTRTGTTTGSTGGTATPRQTARTDASRAPRREEAMEDEEALEEEEGRIRFMYLEASAGMSWINLAVINQDNFIPEFETLKGTGFAVGGGAGFFLSFITLGLQAEYANHDGFDVGVVALDLGIRIPTPHIEPYLRVGVGYAWLFNLDGPMWPSDVGSIRGVCADVGLGFDFMITELVAVGIGVDAAVFNVRRAGVTGAPRVGMVVLEEDGDAVGVQVSALAQLNLHF